MPTGRERPALGGGLMTSSLKPLLAGVALALLALATPAAAAEIKPAVVFDIGSKFDKSFNEGVFNGVEKFKAETKIPYAEFEVQNETQFDQAHRRFAQRGMDPIIAVGFNQTNAVEKIAKEFPKVRWTIIDGVVKLPNV